ncbi:MAG: DeoR/GlpR transcriptional regulator [Chloroflexi bacterium]|nr:DeoR/GlpR transcriptional regulator [Chloroflexota bacterium]
MLTAERQQYILATLQRQGKVIASELSMALDVSEDTIRRDLRKLAEAGLLQRVHGGALPSSPAAASYTARQGQSLSAKMAIAHAAIQLITSGQVIVLDGGTTTLYVAQRLPTDLQATVVTNSPPIAVALANHPRVEVLLVGGRLDKDSLVVIGAATIEAFRMIRADLCMLGICSLHPEVGITVPDLEEAYVKRAMIASAAEVVALASVEKLGTAATYTVGSLTELTHLVTEPGSP